MFEATSLSTSIDDPHKSRTERDLTTVMQVVTVTGASAFRSGDLRNYVKSSSTPAYGRTCRTKAFRRILRSRLSIIDDFA